MILACGRNINYLIISKSKTFATFGALNNISSKLFVTSCCISQLVWAFQCAVSIYFPLLFFVPNRERTEQPGHATGFSLGC